jgi:hypothetical protein
MSTLTTEHIEAPTVEDIDEAIWYAHIYGHPAAVDRWLDARLEACGY